MNNQLKERLEALQKQLEKQEEWPMVYFFKFILTAEGSQQKDDLEVLRQLFQGHAIDEKASSGGKYISFSVKTDVKSVEDILEKYRGAAVIQNIILL